MKSDFMNIFKIIPLTLTYGYEMKYIHMHKANITYGFLWIGKADIKHENTQ